MPPTVLPNAEGKGMMSIPLTGQNVITGGGLASIPNLNGVNLLILRSYLYVANPSAGAANIDVGVGAAANTDATDIISALAVNGGIAGNYYNGNTIQTTTKTQCSVPAVWSTGKFLNVTGSADTTGFVGTLYVEYLRL